MRRFSILFTVIICLTLSAATQPKSLDKIFEKYSGKEGFVTVDLTDPSMLSSLAPTDDKKNEVEEAIKQALNTPEVE